jgi:5'/3'-nucleotidase SurE
MWLFRRLTPPRRLRRWLLCITLLTTIPSPAFALRILLTNDDGFESRYLQRLFAVLQAAGHDVLLSAPYNDQSGLSAALGRLSDFPPTRTASPGGTIAAGAPGTGPTTLAAGQYYVDGTPVAAVIHGLETLAPAHWKGLPDLVIAGPNFGSNLGTVTPHSGTVGAAITAINRGIPALAISSANADFATADLLGEIVLRILAATLDQGRVALPVGTGLNVNVPALDPTRSAASYRCVYTRINTPGVPSDSHLFSERIAAFDPNTITVSPIQGTYQAPPDQAAQILARMQGLFAASIAIANPKLTNLSVRGTVGTGSAVQIAGLYVSGTTPKTLLIRASGPALSAFGVTGVLLDPLLEVYDRDNQRVAANDNWSDTPTAATAIAAAAARLGAFAWTAGSADAAVLITLAPGSYTVVVRGAGNTTGIAAIEAYDANVD